jgi:hypothetical protein
MSKNLNASTRACCSTHATISNSYFMKKARGLRKDHVFQKQKLNMKELEGGWL